MKKQLLRALFVPLALLLITQVIADPELDRLIEQTGVKAGDIAMRDRPGWREPRKIIVRDVLGFYTQVAGTVPAVELVAVREEEEAIGHAADADAIIGFCSERIVAAAPKVMWIQIFAAGAERCLAVDRVASGDIVLTNMQKMSSPVIAEHVTAMVLGLARGLGPFSKAMAQGEWQRNSGITGSMQSIGGKTVLVLGLGGIGLQSARRLAALDMKIIATRRSS
ncbi:MAG: hypothetical protein OEN51_10990, partial [Gammaproteobacteria bacterium]|nr:hypothetical protein [Gammaproteobacteria bacterium]